MKDHPKFTVLTHFEELRRRILTYLGVLFALWVILFTQFQHLVPYLLMPYQKAFPERELTLVFTSLPEAIMAALKSTFFLALAFSLPVLVFEAWRFLAPALYPEEKRFLRRVLLFVTIFGAFGLALAYLLVLPSLLKVFLGLGYRHFAPLLRVQSYLSFLGKGLLIAAILSQIPLITATLIKLDLLPSRLGKKRHLYLLAFAYGLGLFISPGDFLGQLLLASLFWALLESGFLIAKAL